MKKTFFYRQLLLLLIHTFFIANLSHAQWYDPEKTDKKVRAIYVKAYDNAMDENYDEAMGYIEQVLKADPRFVEAYLTRANIYAVQKKYKASVDDFDKAYQLDSVFSSVYQLPYSISLAGIGAFDRALKLINDFLSTPGLNERSVKSASYRKAVYEFAIDYAAKHPAGNYKFSPENMGDNINTTELEYFPSLTIDRKKIVFSRKGKGDEDFYESNLVDGKWSKAVPLPGKINTNLNEGAQNISQDGELLVFTGCFYPEGQGSCDLYIAHKTKNGSWSEPENLGPYVNTDFWESSPSLSPDKKDLYFISDQPGGYGGKDIWVTHRLPSGKWSRSENLGKTVNTSGDEGSVFMHADGQTLYFNSNGHMGYGGTDLFLSRKSADGSWSEPENLGYPINTIDDEGTLFVSSDGKTGYYASDGIDSKGGLDIYTFQLRDDIKAARTLWVKGKVYDKKTNAGLPSTVELTEINSRSLISNLQTDEDGNYLVTLPEGKDYAFNVNRKGYLFYSDNFSLIKNTTDSFYTVDIPLQPIEAGAAIVLKNIFFENNKSELNPASITELDKVVSLLNDNPKLTIQISGHTDNVGKSTDNLTLSLNRAKSVTAYLVSKGINTKRLIPKGFGATAPVAGNDTEEGRSKNRRTELNVLSN